MLGKKKQEEKKQNRKRQDDARHVPTISLPNIGNHTETIGNESGEVRHVHTNVNLDSESASIIVGCIFGLLLFGILWRLEGWQAVTAAIAGLVCFAAVLTTFMVLSTRVLHKWSEEGTKRVAYKEFANVELRRADAELLDAEANLLRAKGEVVAQLIASQSMQIAPHIIGDEAPRQIEQIEIEPEAVQSNYTDAYPGREIAIEYLVSTLYNSNGTVNRGEVRDSGKIIRAVLGGAKRTRQERSALEYLTDKGIIVNDSNALYLNTDTYPTFAHVRARLE